MVNGRELQDELKRIHQFFNTLSIEEFEKIAFECGAGDIIPSKNSAYVQALNRRYRNSEKVNSEGIDFTISIKETEVA